MDVSYFPFDEQTCFINVAVWGYDTTEVAVHPKMKTSNNSAFVQSSTWLLKNISVEEAVSGTTPYMKITLDIKRYYEYFVVNILLPPTLLSFLDPCVFILPASSGERMSFAVTCFLAFSVFMTMLGDNMPKSSVPVAGISYFMMYMLFHSTAVTLCTIISLRIYCRGEAHTHVPTWVKVVVRVCRLRYCRYYCFHRYRNAGPSVDPYRSETPIEKYVIEDVSNKNDHSDRISRGADDVNMDLRTKMAVAFEHEPEITWTTVGRTMDAVFFIVFVALTVLVIMVTSTKLQIF